MKDRFDLEQQILDCWKVTMDLQDMREVVEEGGLLTYAELEARVKCIEAIYDVKFHKLWNTFSDMVYDKQFVNTKSNNETSN